MCSAVAVNYFLSFSLFCKRFCKVETKQRRTTIIEKLATLKQVHFGGELSGTRLHPFGTQRPVDAS